MEEIMKQGHDIGVELKKSRNSVELLIHKITTNPSNDIESNRKILIEFLMKLGKPVPEFLIDINEEDNMKLTAFLMGMNNGSLKKAK